LLLKVKYFFKVVPRYYKGIHPLGISKIDLATLGNYKGIHPQMLRQSIYFIDTINPIVRH
jgi:hypothetical protein